MYSGELKQDERIQTNSFVWKPSLMTTVYNKWPTNPNYTTVWNTGTINKSNSVTSQKTGISVLTAIRTSGISLEWLLCGLFNDAVSSWGYRALMIWWSRKDLIKYNLEGSTLDIIKIIFPHLPAVTLWTHGKYQPVQSVYWLRFESGTCQTRLYANLVSSTLFDVIIFLLFSFCFLCYVQGIGTDHEFLLLPQSLFAQEHNSWLEHKAHCMQLQTLLDLSKEVWDIEPLHTSIV